ncbi:hypothetical protein [Bacillus sp. V5-8f]|uniref:hypothetical protein n=1 Tax=Bacillus sp. V5-8f TaxID=2053044 RepID=UPI000C779E23|nr:hypothetical protein [Bacillus sp. V5-8f]PLT32000.1 hypothetical protein CUU64_20665 [Bacillus sp. V5-8f]
MTKNSEAREKFLQEMGLSHECGVNAIRQAAVSYEYKRNKERRAFILMGPYPFMVIGVIKEVTSDFVIIKVEATNISELDEEVFRIHLDQIEVFFIEDGKHKIPNLKEGFC